MMVTKTSELIKLIRKLAREECCDKLKARTKSKKKTHLRKPPVANMPSKILTSLFAQALVKRQMMPKRATTAIQQTQTVPLSHTKTQTTQTKTKAKSMKTQTMPVDRHSIGTDTADDFKAIIEKISSKPAQTVTAKDIREKTKAIPVRKPRKSATQKLVEETQEFLARRKPAPASSSTQIVEPPPAPAQTPEILISGKKDYPPPKQGPPPTPMVERFLNTPPTLASDLGHPITKGNGKTKPEDSKVALSDRQINEYMARKQRTRFKGAISRDQIKDVKLNKTTPSSFIFNTAPTTQDGEHWCAVYVDPKKRHLCYYDSFGRDPETDIIGDLTNLVHKLRKMQFQMKINRVQEQHASSHHCGHHCLRFLNKMHIGEAFKQVTPFHSQEEEARKIAKGFGYV